MGCAASRIQREGRVQVCKERKKLMKQLVGYRGEFADAQLAYLRALKNTGVTLRQFTESDSLELENTSHCLTLPPSPPSPLPPPPPPPPSFSPDPRKAGENGIIEAAQDESAKVNQDECSTPPPPTASSSWTYWDLFESTSPLHHPKQSETVEPIQEESWAESRMQFEDENPGEELVEGFAINTPPMRSLRREIADNSSSIMSWYNKDSTDVAMLVLKNNKTLEGIMKDLDDYFLKASAGGKEIAVFTDINIGNNSLPWKLNENKRNRSNSAKVFSALSWSWSSKSLQLARDAFQCRYSKPCNPGAHCITLDKLYVAEQKLYKEVKEEEVTKLELEKKLMLLQKQDENHDWTKTQKIKSSVENLENDMTRLQHSISTACSSILELIDEELYPQLVALTSGLMGMWKMMYKSHQFQNHISKQLNHLTDHLSMDLTTESRLQATAQLETEVSFWYYSFCRLIKSQQEYLRTLCQWIQLTDCLVSNQQQSHCSSAVRRLCEEWHLGFEKLPDKVASETIKSFLLAIQSIIQQQAVEHNQKRKYEKLQKRLQKELISLTEMEKKVEGSVLTLDMNSTLSPKHPLSLKRAKTEALKKRVDVEKGKHLNSVQLSKTMILSNLKTSLPNVFQALMGFSKACVEVFEAIHGNSQPEIPCAS
ncbi:Benzoyl-CoA reductase subunit C [Gossypium arboreum]|uniref:Protein ALTERED PHOSPHATE STARVATION RESPONSE 1 isoform X1 n=6 Tax=Gossypium TaxID=3633 RepID=A0A1U8KR01_GOSHI|nr:protein ALTERED PHOSPHATE STARVATION RESPONSE 1 isoform X1 [Gossypium hirsutum]XP_016703140.1 protein ALTERED PHOSPHATE STARVATION RESPONSE 1 isoform X1 [Gossypium hirsutum]XP_016703141.1 protein ALTERED PHOSPHATE STARVATION RESPONSE 1 isoform X1 [Gossypium hirsutum]XP_016703143.1 protein ALTERED PHOSPHATE STARVATION RESPONSE 1 isoform X1 [Gossypium hirsutum]XP_016703144.1 protein ALTERED PHOSPHATE STARVATION RESPONSE 1 isoform X1 [Gossypium hirsutum]XP_017642769.1 protein ALTERED PHOSPHATE